MSNFQEHPVASAEISQSNPAAQIEWLELQLQDAHLVIGRQQMALLRAEQINVSLQKQLEQLAEQQASD